MWAAFLFMDERQQRWQALREAMAERILVLDGAMGTMIQQRNLSAADYGGAAYEGCPEILNVTQRA
jgi:5-methyltetrahydrofolate--homocysteine methyltransferase